MIEPDKCENPFRKRRCGRTDIAVYIMVKEKRIPICTRCWLGKKKDGSDGLAESDHSWGEWGMK